MLKKHTIHSGVGTAGAPGTGVPVKFYWSEVEGHTCGSAEVAKQFTLASELRPSPFTRALPVFSGVHAPLFCARVNGVMWPVYVVCIYFVERVFFPADKW